jgi:hypothetical protein
MAWEGDGVEGGFGDRRERGLGAPGSPTNPWRTSWGSRVPRFLAFAGSSIRRSNLYTAGGPSPPRACATEYLGCIVAVHRYTDIVFACGGHYIFGGESLWVAATFDLDALSPNCCPKKESGHHKTPISILSPFCRPDLPNRYLRAISST